MPAVLALAAGLALTVVDVDTVRLGGARLRLAGLDGPERADHCVADIRHGGTRALQRIVDQAEVLELDFIEDGKWIPIVVLRADGQDVSTVLIEAGWARPYDGGEKEAWCPPAD